MLEVESWTFFAPQTFNIQPSTKKRLLRKDGEILKYIFENQKELAFRSAYRRLRL